MSCVALSAWADGDLQPYLAGFRRKAEALMRASAIDLRTLSVTVRATLDADGWVRGLTILRGSGSSDVDGVIFRALCRMFVEDPPAALVGVSLSLELGERSPG